MYFPKFETGAFRQDVHWATYKCVASNSGGTIISRDLSVKAGKPIIFNKAYSMKWTYWKKMMSYLYQIQVGPNILFFFLTRILPCSVHSICSKYSTSIYNILTFSTCAQFQSITSWIFLCMLAPQKLATNWNIQRTRIYIHTHTNSCESTVRSRSSKSSRFHWQQCINQMQCANIRKGLCFGHIMAAGAII